MAIQFIIKEVYGEQGRISSLLELASYAVPLKIYEVAEQEPDSTLEEESELLNFPYYVRPYMLLNRVFQSITALEHSDILEKCIAVFSDHDFPHQAHNLLHYLTRLNLDNLTYLIQLQKSAFQIGRLESWTKQILQLARDEMISDVNLQAIGLAAVELCESTTIIQRVVQLLADNILDSPHMSFNDECLRSINRLQFILKCICNIQRVLPEITAKQLIKIIKTKNHRLSRQDLVCYLLICLESAGEDYQSASWTILQNIDMGYTFDFFGSEKRLRELSFCFQSMKLDKLSNTLNFIIVTHTNDSETSWIQELKTELTCYVDENKKEVW